jgi:hypothetical protein
VLIPFNAREGQPIPPYKSKTNAPPGFPSITFFYLPISRRASAILEGKEKPKSIEGILELLQELTRYEMLIL